MFIVLLATTDTGKMFNHTGRGTPAVFHFWVVLCDFCKADLPTLYNSRVLAYLKKLPMEFGKIWNPFPFAGLPDLDFLNVVCVAELKGIMQDALRLGVAVLSQHLAHAFIIGGEAGTVNLHVSVGQNLELSVHFGLVLIDKILEITGADTRLFIDHHRVGRFKQIVNLPIGQGHGQPIGSAAV